MLKHIEHCTKTCTKNLNALKKNVKHKADVADVHHTQTCRHHYIKATHKHKNKNKDEKNQENVKKQAKQKEKKKWRTN
jgi:hypothetical protein